MRWMIGIVILLILLFGAWIAYPFLVPPTAPNSEHAIVINKALNILYYYTDGNLHKAYSVATGYNQELTPEGNFRIISKADDNGLGQESVFGTRWMGLEVPGQEDGTYGIHGTNEPKSIGSHVSAGCVRMREADIEELYDKVPIGTPVTIVSGTIVHRYLIDMFT